MNKFETGMSLQKTPGWFGKSFFIETILRQFMVGIIGFQRIIIFPEENPSFKNLMYERAYPLEMFSVQNRFTYGEEEMGFKHTERCLD